LVDACTQFTRQAVRDNVVPVELQLSNVLPSQLVELGTQTCTGTQAPAAVLQMVVGWVHVLETVPVPVPLQVSMIRLLLKQRWNALGVQVCLGTQVPALLHVPLVPALMQDSPLRLRNPQPVALHTGPTHWLLAASSGQVWGVPGWPLTQGVNTLPVQLPVVQRGGGAAQVPPWQVWPGGQFAFWN
jgi:hypothetical protein